MNPFQPKVLSNVLTTPLHIETEIDLFSAFIITQSVALQLQPPWCTLNNFLPLLLLLESALQALASSSGGAACPGGLG